MTQKTQRTRIINGMTKLPNLIGLQYDRPGSNVSYSENTDYNAYVGTYKSIVDYVTPGFKSLVKRGAIVNNPVVIKGSSVYADVSPVSISSVADGNGNYYNWVMTGQPMSREIAAIASANNGFTDFRPFYGDPSLTTMSTLVNRAAIQALGKVEPPQMQAFVTLAELNKTVALIGTTARNLANAIDAIKRGKPDRAIARALGRPNARRQPHPVRYTSWDSSGNPVVFRGGKPKSFYGHSPRQTSTAKSPIDEATSRWLEWRYGWGPMVMDIVSALKALNKQREIRRFMVRGSAKDEKTRSYTTTSVKGYGTHTFRVDVSHSRTARAYVLYEVSNEPLARLQDFGVFDFPASAWELLPWSFVVDWFVPVGDWIKALTPKIGVNILASGSSMRENIAVKRTITGWSPNGTSPGSWPSFGMIGKADGGSTAYYERTDVLLTPSFPPSDVNLNVKRAIDGIALLRGALGRK